MFHHSYVLALLLSAASFGISFFSIATSRRPVVSDVQEVAPADLVPPTIGQQAFNILWSTGNLFRVLVCLLARGLLASVGWLREAGFASPSRIPNACLLAPPLLVGILALSAGVRVEGVWLFLATLLTVLVATFGEEALFRGLMLRTLAPSGLVKAVLLTSLLAGALQFGASTLTGPWPEAVLATILTTCAGFTYAALRWRTTSIWPVLGVHTLVSFAVVISTPGALLYLLLLLLSTFGFVAYGLFLLRNSGARGDGGPEIQRRQMP